MEIKDILKKETNDNNPFLEGIKYTSLDGKKFDSVDEALEYNKMFCEKLGILKTEEDENVKTR